MYFDYVFYYVKICNVCRQLHIFLQILRYLKYFIISRQRMNIGSGSIVGDNLASTLEAQTSAGLKNFVHLFNFLTFELKKKQFLHATCRFSCACASRTSWRSSDHSIRSIQFFLSIYWTFPIGFAFFCRLSVFLARFE